MHEPTGSSSNTRRTAAPSRTTDIRRSLAGRRIGGADILTLSAAGTRPIRPLSAYGHNWRTACRWSSIHLGGQSHGLFDQRLDDLRFGHGFDHFTADEDLALAVTRGNAEVGLASLPRAVDHTAHHGHPQRHIEPVQTGGDFVGQFVNVDLGATARRAGHDLEAPRPKVQRLENLGADLDFLDRWRRQRHPDGVADPARQQGAECDRGLDGALEGRAGLGNAEVQRIVALRGELLVGRDHHHRVVVLDADLDIAEAVLLEQRGLPQRRLDQRLRGGLAVLLHEPLVQRPGIDADADRNARCAGSFGDLTDPAVEFLDVTGVYPHRGAAGVDRGEDVLRLEMDVSDDGNLALRGDRG